jgi:hypothetical protein
VVVHAVWDTMHKIITNELVTDLWHSVKGGYISKNNKQCKLLYFLPIFAKIPGIGIIFDMHRHRSSTVNINLRTIMKKL